ncbi:hypothetical protein GGI23_006812, partial [Coemansia sp. RSA 2559]
MTEAYQQLTTQLVGSLEKQFGVQASQLGNLISKVNEIASTSNEKMDETLQRQLQAYNKELATLAQTVQSLAPAPPQSATTTVVATPPMNATNSPRLSSVSSLAHAYQTMGTSPARFSLGSMQSARNERRSISGIDDASVLDSHPKSVVATLVNEMSKGAGAAGDTNADGSLSGSPASLPSSRKSLGPTAAANSAPPTSSVSPVAARVARAERRVSAGLASDTLSVIGNKCDRMAALFESYAGEIEKVQQSQASLLELCSALQQAVDANGSGGAPPRDAPADAPSTSAYDGSRTGRRKTEQLRRRGGMDLFGSVGKESTHPIEMPSATADAKAFELYKAAADELVASLKGRLVESESARTAAEGRAAELLGWIGRESKGRALLEDMIRTAQQACKMAEEKLDAMLRETERQKEDLQGKDDEIARLQQTIDTRDKELRHLRRASRKALDQLADIKNTQEQQQQHKPPQVPSRNDSIAGSGRQQELESELQEAAAVHVRLQFEIAHLESEISRLEDEKTQLARDLGRRDKRILGLEKRLRSSEEASEGIR